MYHRFIKQVPPGIISIINASFIRFASKASSQYYQQQHKIYSSKLPPNIIIMINTRFIIFSSKTSSRYRQHRHQRKCYHNFINKFLPISSATAQDLSYVHQTLPPSVISIFIIVSSKLPPGTISISTIFIVCSSTTSSGIVIINPRFIIFSSQSSSWYDHYQHHHHQ